MSGHRIQLYRLYERTSQRGSRYLSGRLGQARLIAFEADVPEGERYGAEVVWNVYLQAPDEDRDQAPRQQSPTRNAQRVQSRWDRSRDAGLASDAQRSFHDDSQEAIADLEGRR